MAELVALGLKSPQIDTMGAFQQGALGAARLNEAKREQAERAMQTIGAVALGAMGGKLDGPVDPQKFEQGLDILQGMGMQVDQFRGKPQMAPLAARASMSALQQLQTAQNERQFDFLMQKFGREVMQADRSYALDREKFDFDKSKSAGAESPLGKLKSDLNAGLISKDEYDAAVQKANSTKGGITIDPDGTVTVGGSLTEGQAKVAGYAQRMENAERELNTAPDGGSSIIEQAEPGTWSANPFSGDFWTTLNRKYGPNANQSPEYQRYVNGAKEWVRAKLRKESGAAISKEEWETEFTTYFPQPGDGPDVIKQKKRLRDNAFDSVRGESRGGYDALFGQRQKRAAASEETGDAAAGGNAPVYARNPQTGERVMLQNGQWVPAR